MDTFRARAIPKPEYPRPQLVREQWMNLNGVWEFEADAGKSGRSRGLHKADRLEGTILVPFPPESRLSGVEKKDFLNAVWYRKEVDVPAHWREARRVMLHFGAVDYAAELWINGAPAGRHRGGYTPFTTDITELLQDGRNVISLCAEDDPRTSLQPRGKQSAAFHSWGCDYSRTTGIWQTVWMESVPPTRLAGMKMLPDVDNESLHVDAAFAGETSGCTLMAEAFYKGEPAGSASAVLSGPSARLSVRIDDIRLWEPGKPELYDLKLSVLKGGEAFDVVTSYFGMRKITLSGKKVLLNDKPVFQRLVLDQGFYPEGIYTSPSDADLKQDIELAMELGFNGARMHQKVFEPRYMYWADRLGFLVWGEYADWGLDVGSFQAFEIFLPQWLEAVDRDFNHPSIIGWCPFNEIQKHSFVTERGDFVLLPHQDDEAVRWVYRLTKIKDPTRPVIDVSGFFHVETDIFDAHCYDQNPETFSSKLEAFRHGGKPYISFNYSDEKQKYEGQPYFMSEYGGIFWSPGETLSLKGWEEGRPKTIDEFYYRYEGLTRALLEHPNISGFCYTQLYDIEQEVNGLLTYDRKAKFDHARIRAVNTGKAAIESQRYGGGKL